MLQPRPIVEYLQLISDKKYFKFIEVEKAENTNELFHIYYIFIPITLNLCFLHYRKIITI